MNVLLMICVALTIFNLAMQGPPSKVTFWCSSFLVLNWTAAFAADVVQGDRVDAIIHACLVGANAYLAWKNRPPGGKRLADKVTGVVKNLGHKLVVAPIGAGAR